VNGERGRCPCAPCPSYGPGFLKATAVLDDR